MREIVINTCYGGFGLSAEAIVEIAKTQGKQVFFYQNVSPLNSYPLFVPNKFVKITPPFTSAFHYSLLVDLGETTDKLPNDSSLWFNDRDIPRDDPDLIRVVKKLKEKANGPCACLKIIKIPDDIKWEIEEYDGMELVAESHRTWE